MKKILVVDDEMAIRLAFEAFLKDDGYSPLLAREADSAMSLIREHRPEIVFLDYRLPGRDGLSVLEEIRAFDPTIAVIFMTAFGAMDVAIKAMQMGAHEYLTKPLDLEKVRRLIRRTLAIRESLGGRGRTETASLPPPEPGEQMVGQSPAMQVIFKTIGLLTTQDVTVLITGESGVGKELVARAIHDNSPRRDEPFIAVNCGAMPETLLESEMFGYEKGAFTGADTRKLGKFEVAGAGTVFLDEIGELQPLLQVKLLRVLQERCFERVGGNTLVQTHARVVAATNKDLREEMQAGRFRRDLFYRLHLVNIHIPPLRERHEDIPPLVQHFIQKANKELKRQVSGVTAAALDRLARHPWPGNVRELENQIKRAMVLSREEILSEDLFELDLESSEVQGEATEDRLTRVTRQILADAVHRPQAEAALMDRLVGLVEKTLIEESLHRCGGNQVQAALMLGVHRSTLRKKMKDYGI